MKNSSIQIDMKSASAKKGTYFLRISFLWRKVMVFSFESAHPDRQHYLPIFFIVPKHDINFNHRHEMYFT